MGRSGGTSGVILRPLSLDKKLYFSAITAAYGKLPSGSVSTIFKPASDEVTSPFLYRITLVGVSPCLNLSRNVFPRCGDLDSKLVSNGIVKSEGIHNV